MLVIRREQMAALLQAPRRDFEDSLLRHFSQYYARDYERLGEGTFRKLIQMGIGRAESHGFASRQEVGLYCNLMLMLGADFDRDPQIPWAARQAADWSVPSSLQRIEGLFAGALQYLGESFGDDGGYLARALVRIRDYDLMSCPEAAGAELESELLKLLQFLCPQKYKAQGEEPVRELIRQAMEDAGRYGISGGKGLVVYTTLMFMLGAGFYRDPVYPWAGAILNDPAIANGAERVDLLYQASIAYINRVLGG